MHARKTTYIAWDGEGITEDGVHKYVLLANSLGKSIEDRRGITAYAALEFIWRTHLRYPHAKHVIFSGGYDFNFILRGRGDTLGYLRATRIHKGIPTRIERWPVRLRRSLEVMPPSTRTVAAFNRDSVILWDMWRFYQCSFIRALEMQLPTYPALQEIRDQKARRSHFTWDELPAIKHYCFMELEALVSLSQKLLDEDMHTAGIGNLSALNGAGSAAAKQLKQNHIRDYIAPLPPEVERATWYAYSGGRIESWKFGNHIGEFYTHDIRSAYPSAMLDLPTLVDGIWHRTTEFEGVRFGVYRVRFHTTRADRGFPFFQRVASGTILYPASVEGWYWNCELESAYQSGFHFDILDGWALEPSTTHTPFQYILAAYGQRALFAADGNLGAALALKLAYNATYGKLAQTLGASAQKHAAHFCLAWAGYITAKTRSRVFDVAMQSPNDIAYIATDGIGATRRLDVDEGKGLGQWEVERYDGATLIQPGVYFLYRNYVGPFPLAVYEKYRGFDRGSIDVAAITASWRRQDFTPAKCPATRFITLGSALASRERYDNDWCQWRTIDRELAIDGSNSKRTPRSGTLRPHLRLEDLEPITSVTDYHSTPYSPKWKDVTIDLDGTDIDNFEREVEMYAERI